MLRRYGRGIARASGDGRLAVIRYGSAKRRWLRSAAVISMSDRVGERNLPQQTDLLAVYRGLVAVGRIRPDDDQVRVVMELRRLQKALRDYAPPAFVSQYYRPDNEANGIMTGDELDSKSNKPWYSANQSTPKESSSFADLKAIVKLRSQAEALAELQTPKGLLLTGPPGCGKSFLIDLWLSTMPTPFKTRKHYSELVLEIYRGVWEETQRRKTFLYNDDTSQETSQPRWTKAVREHWRNLLQSGSLPTSWKSTARLSTHSVQPSLPPIAFVIALRLVLQHWLLVFDELQLLDVSSAGLLADVLAWFWRMGGVVVASSNKVPDELYRGGVQRERLEPFVEALKARCPVLVMRGENDWRRKRAGNGDASYWFTSLREGDFRIYVKELMDGPSVTSAEISVFGRRLIIPCSSGTTCKFTFSELCDQSLGAADYISIAAKYRTVIITSIPILRVSAKDQSRRFISLIDALYEARCRVVALAEAQLDELFFPDAPTSEFDSGSDTKERNRDADSQDDQIMAEAFSESREVFRPNISSYEDRPERPAASPLSLDSLSIFSGEEERFAYKRALSRLIEMTSDQYATNDEWNPISPNSRKWEISHSEASSSDSLSMYNTKLATQGAREAFRRCAGDRDGPFGDFAEEAAYEGEAEVQRHVRDAQRPGAPRLDEKHAWGVREDWGKKAGKWGKGATVFDDRE